MLHETFPVEEKDLLDQNVTSGDDDQGGQNDDAVLQLVDNESILSEDILAELDSDAFDSLERMGGSSLASHLKDAAKNLSDQGQLRTMVREALGRVQHENITATNVAQSFDIPHEDNIIEFVAKPVAEPMIGSVQILSDDVQGNAVAKKAPAEQAMMSPPISDVTEAVLKTVERIVASSVVVPVKQMDAQDNHINAVLVQPAVQDGVVEAIVPVVVPLRMETVEPQAPESVMPLSVETVSVVQEIVPEIMPEEVIQETKGTPEFVVPLAVDAVVPQVVPQQPMQVQTITASYTMTETVAVAVDTVQQDIPQDIVVDVTHQVSVDVPVDTVVAKQEMFGAFIEQEKTLLDVVAPMVALPVVAVQNDITVAPQVADAVPAVAAKVIAIETAIEIVSDVPLQVEQDIIATIQEPVADVFVTEDDVTIVVEEVSTQDVQDIVQDAVVMTTVDAAEDVVADLVEEEQPVDESVPLVEKTVALNEKENAVSVVSKQVDTAQPVQKAVVEKTVEAPIAVEEPQTLLNVFAQSFDDPEQIEQKEKEFANNATSKGVMQDVFAPEAVERDYFATLMSAMSRYP